MADPLEDFMEYDAECARREKRIPICVNCGERCYGEHWFNVDGDYWCEDCEEDLKDVVWDNIKHDFMHDVEPLEDDGRD